MNKYIYILGISILESLIFQTCNKVKCLECDKCENFPKDVGGISSITQKSNQRHSPCFNPENANEFIYVKEEDNHYHLIKYNLQFKTETILLANTSIVGQPKWNRNGWIVFAKLDLNIYKIKDNGDSLKQITHYFENNYPCFLGTDKILISVRVETSPGAVGNKINNLYGDRIDSFQLDFLPGVLRQTHCNNLNQIVGSLNRDNNISLQVINYPSKEKFEIFSSEFIGRNDITGISWHPNNDDVYFSTYREGLYMVNKNSKKVVKVRNGCDSRSYRFLSISPDWKRIIVERVDATDFDKGNGSWTEESKIYIMDVNGENERNVFE